MISIKTIKHAALSCVALLAIASALPSYARSQKEGAVGFTIGRSTADAENSAGGEASYSQVKFFLNEMLSNSGKMELSYSSNTGPKFTGQELKTKITAFDYLLQESGTGFYGRIGLGYANHSEKTAYRTVKVNEFVPRAGIGFEWIGNSQFGVRIDLGTDFGVGDSSDQNWSGNLTVLSIGLFSNF
jgi:hypothetical protein